MFSDFAKQRARTLFENEVAYGQKRCSPCFYSEARRLSESSHPVDVQSAVAAQEAAALSSEIERLMLLSLLTLREQGVL